MAIEADTLTFRESLPPEGPTAGGETTSRVPLAKKETVPVGAAPLLLVLTVALILNC